jgi:predicted metal-dependent hydrolase
VHYVRSRRARRINVSVKIGQAVRVAMPVGISLSVAEQFLMKQREFVIKSLAKLQVRTPPVFRPGDQRLKTRGHQLVIEICKQSEIAIRKTGSRILITYPASLAVTDPLIQDAIKKGLLTAYREEARNYLPRRLEELARRHQFLYQQLFIKSLKSRWGSCSAKNNINLNLQLMRLPDDLIDYVMLHELIHTKIKNHSASFWQALQNLMPDYQYQRNQLRGHFIL